jgi:hypothetical protein
MSDDSAGRGTFNPFFDTAFPASKSGAGLSAESLVIKVYSRYVEDLRGTEDGSILAPCSGEWKKERKVSESNNDFGKTMTKLPSKSKKRPAKKLLTP